MIVLSDLDGTDSMMAAFENGARAYIPTGSTTVAIVVEAIRPRDLFVPEQPANDKLPTVNPRVDAAGQVQ